MAGMLALGSGGNDGGGRLFQGSALKPKLRDWKWPIRHPHCVSRAPQLLPGIDLIQGLRVAKPWKRKRGSA